MDESGDLGFTGKSSRVFILVGILTYNPKEVENCIKHTRKRKLAKDNRRSGVGEIKFHQSSDEVRDYVLKLLGKKAIQIAYAAVLWKDRVKQALRQNPDKLYHYLILQVVRKLLKKTKGEDVDLVVDRSMYGEELEDFNSYLKSDAYRKVLEIAGDSIALKPTTLPVRIRHESSNSSNGLQAADFVAGAVFQCLKDDRRDNRYYRLISNRIIGDYLFPRKE